VAYTRTALVTGASSGIGYHVCRHLAGHGIRVIVHAPTSPEAHAAVDRLIRDGADPGLLHPAAADYRRLSDVTSLAGHLDRNHDRLDLLINNAGALAPATRTVDGFDSTLQINYLAHYVLTRMLGRALNAAGGRVVTVGSALHRQGHLDPSSPASPAGPAGVRPGHAYANAKLALVLFTRALALATERRVTAVAVHPGHIDTGTFTAVYGAGGLPVADGAAHILHAADPAVEVVNGGYYEGLLPGEAAPAARDATAAVRLWRATARLLDWDYTIARPARLRAADARAAA
jgi:NAD(P)-dependent dehydrogenase (short-subunit alcohol dehydrogenase family)